MKLGLALPHYDFSFPDGEPVTLARVVDYACRAEAAGFDSVWVSDHLFLETSKYGGSADRAKTPEAVAMLSAIAAATTNVRLGPLVLCAPFRNPAVLALQAQTLTQAAPDRIELGLGAGWYQAEFDAAGIPFGSFDERAAILAASADAARPHVPVFFGGKGGDKLARLIARHADGWNTCWLITPETYKAKLETLDRACDATDRDRATLKLSVGLYTLVARDDADLERRLDAMMQRAPAGMRTPQVRQSLISQGLVGTLDQCAERLKKFEALGVDEVIVSLGALPFSVADDEQIDLVARELGAMVR
jgi:alkanesulfonate monooxygenase SsuD/methylene tetrahydromethanopterin reductase-like flavin-dependent oxidoreductase (luciferase family)